MHDAWDRAKARYQDIPIPDELSPTVRAAIRTGSRQSRRRRHWFQGGAMGLAACICFCVLVNSTPAFAAAVADIPVLGALARVVSIEQYMVQDEYQYIRVNMPALENTGNTELEQRVNTEIRTRIEQVLQEAENRARSVRDAYVETGGDAAEFIPVIIDVDYEIKCQNDQYLSFILTETETRASAYTEVYTYNIDLEAGRELTLRDMLGPDYVELANAAVREGIAAREAADPDATFFHDEAGFTSIDEDQAFYINEAGNPVVLFEKYELAPGYMGQLEFEVPVP